MPVKHLPVDSIRTDGGTQVRAETNDSCVAEYADAWRDFMRFPPLVVFRSRISETPCSVGQKNGWLPGREKDPSVLQPMRSWDAQWQSRR